MHTVDVCRVCLSTFISYAHHHHNYAARSVEATRWWSPLPSLSHTKQRQNSHWWRLQCPFEEARHRRRDPDSFESWTVHEIQQPCPPRFSGSPGSRRCLQGRRIVYMGRRWVGELLGNALPPAPMLRQRWFDEDEIRVPSNVLPHVGACCDLSVESVSADGPPSCHSEQIDTALFQDDGGNATLGV